MLNEHSVSSRYDSLSKNDKKFSYRENKVSNSENNLRRLIYFMLIFPYELRRKFSNGWKLMLLSLLCSKDVKQLCNLALNVIDDHVATGCRLLTSVVLIRVQCVNILCNCCFYCLYSNVYTVRWIRSFISLFLVDQWFPFTYHLLKVIIRSIQ